MSVYFTGFILPDRAGAVLRKMINGGLYGHGDSEALAHIALVAVQRAIEAGLVEMPPEEEGLEAPPQGTAYKCGHCEDGMRLDKTCPKCGSEPEIPF